MAFVEALAYTGGAVIEGCAGGCGGGAAARACIGGVAASRGVRVGHSVWVGLGAVGLMWRLEYLLTVPFVNRLDQLPTGILCSSCDLVVSQTRLRFLRNNGMRWHACEGDCGMMQRVSPQGWMERAKLEG